MKNEIWKTLTAERSATAADYAIRFASNFWEGTSEEDKQALTTERLKRHWTPITNSTKLANGANVYRFVECGVYRRNIERIAQEKWGFTEAEAKEISNRVSEAIKTIVRG